MNGEGKMNTNRERLHRRPVDGDDRTQGVETSPTTLGSVELLVIREKRDLNLSLERARKPIKR